MDYSLLVGIHNVDEELRRQKEQKEQKDQKDETSPKSPVVDGMATLPLMSRQQHQSTMTTGESPLQRSSTVRRLYSIIPESAQAQTPTMNSIEESTSIPYEVP